MKLFFFIAVFCLLTGCFKRNEANVNAPCTDSCMTFNIRVATGVNSAIPLANTPIEIGWSRPVSPLGNPGRLIAKGTTASDGFISVSFKAQAKELEWGRFYVVARKGSGYFYQENDYFGVQKYDSVVTANLHVPSKATLKIIYKNFNPLGSEDFFQCLPYFPTYGSTGIPVEMKKPDGQASNTSFFTSNGAFARLELTGTTAGDQYTYLDIIKIKGGASVTVRDSVYIAKGQTKTYEVEF